ncbi:MAG: lipocalin family protein [Bacteroidota bacterium]
MKRNLLVFGMILSVGLITSCGDDDDGPTVSPIVGEWELDEVNVEAANSGFSNINGDRNSSLFGENDYIIEFNQDNTYERELRFFDGDVEEDGEWELDGNELELDPEDNTILITDFELIDVSEDELILKGETDIFILLPDFVRPDTIFDTSVRDSLFDVYGETQNIILTYTFEKD